MASLRKRSASRSENSCPSNSAIFRSADCAWSRSAIPEPVVNSFLPLASPGPYNSTPSPVWYTVSDVACAREGLLLSREAPVFAHHSKNLHIGYPQGSERKDTSLLCMGFQLSAPRTSRTGPRHPTLFGCPPLS